MQGNSWLARLDTLLDAAAVCDGEPATLRDLTFGAYRLLEDGSAAVQNAFQDATEDQLAQTQRQDGEALSQGQWVRPASPDTLVEGVVMAGCLLRALEQALIGLGGLKARPVAAAFRAEFAGETGWILPFKPRYREPFYEAPPYFRKRGLAQHRCLPECLPDGHKIDLRTFDQTVGDEIAAIASLFDHVALTGPDGNALAASGKFVVDGIAGRAPGVIAAALKAACEAPEKPDLIAFPELSIRPEDRTEIQTLLRTRPWDADLTGHRPALVFAGSWHDVIEDGADAGRRRNRAPVYDAKGEIVGHHDKHEPYVSGGGTGRLVEDIVRGDSILVLASPGLTLAVAICLDFCTEARVRPHEHLDVDLIVVVSFGGASTTRSHARMAEQLWNTRKSGTFLVQQDEAKPFGVSGACPGNGDFIETATTGTTARKISAPG